MVHIFLYTEEFMVKKFIFLIAIVLIGGFVIRGVSPKDKVLSLFVTPTPTSIPPTPTITPTPLPTLTPTPTPEPTPAGFCVNVPVVFYHHVQPLDQADKEGHKNMTVAPENFESQMKFLNDHRYRSIKAEELVNALKAHQPLGKVVVVTMDDGYADMFSYAYPIARKYNIILNLMIPTGLMENPGYLSWNSLKEMVSNGMVAYNHTWSHFSLPAGNDSKLDAEVMVPKKQLEEHLGKTVDILTYPYGSVDNRVIRYLSNKGFLGAFTTRPGQLQCEVYIMTLHRTRIGNAPLSSYGL